MIFIPTMPSSYDNRPAVDNKVLHVGDWLSVGGDLSHYGWSPVYVPPVGTMTPDVTLVGRGAITRLIEAYYPVLPINRTVLGILYPDLAVPATIGIVQSLTVDGITEAPVALNVDVTGLLLFFFGTTTGSSLGRPFNLAGKVGLDLDVQIVWGDL